ncbi:Uncharacterised protein [Acinetobacter baumannii]|nr:Uncharacterised protein [Acinetobacter baumannii]
MFAIAAASAIELPRRRNKGTVITLPPTPKSAATQPIIPPLMSSLFCP